MGLLLMQAAVQLGCFEGQGRVGSLVEREKNKLLRRSNGKRDKDAGSEAC